MLNNQSVAGLKCNKKSFLDLETKLLQQPFISIDNVLTLKQPTVDFLCQPEANVFGVDFLKFQIRDLDKNKIICEVNPQHNLFESRTVRYKFKPEFLDINVIGTTVEFVVNQNINDFRMIERHYFQRKLLKSFDLTFGYCIPNSINTCEHIYAMPYLSNMQKQDMINHPYETKSDSFYFADGKLFMHNKAEYAFNDKETVVMSRCPFKINNNL